VVCGAVGQLNLHLPCALLMALTPNTRVTHARLSVTRPSTFSRAPTLDIPNHAARYVCTGTLLNVTEARHFALSVPLYTHFTSPIRRMADVVVHSLLDATLTDSQPWYSEEEVQRQARVCNDRNQAAKKAQEASEKLFMNLFVLHSLHCLHGVCVCVCVCVCVLVSLW
jgi:hypothetical protein